MVVPFGQIRIQADAGIRQRLILSSLSLSPAAHSPQSIDVQQSLCDAAIVHDLGKEIVVGKVTIDASLGLLQAVATPAQKGNEEVIVGAGTQMRLLSYPHPQYDNVLLYAVGRLVQLLLGQLGQRWRELTSHLVAFSAASASRQHFANGLSTLHVGLI